MFVCPIIYTITNPLTDLPQILTEELDRTTEMLLAWV